MAEAAQREWEQARRLDRKIPVLHRNLGLTLLHAGHDAKAALEVFLEGMDADPANIDLYLGADQAMNALGRPATERIAALSRYPDRATMPPTLVQKLALALAEGGRADEAETLFAGRFFPRAEQGTNVRQVYVEVEMQKALAVVGDIDRAVLVDLQPVGPAVVLHDELPIAFLADAENPPERTPGRAQERKD